MWRPEVDVGCFPQIFLPIIFGDMASLNLELTNSASLTGFLLWGPSWLSSAGTVGACHHAQLFRWVLGPLWSHFTDFSLCYLVFISQSLVVVALSSCLNPWCGVF